MLILKVLLTNIIFILDQILIQYNRNQCSWFGKVISITSLLKNQFS
nr:MAG TPA: hypothetical protein [Bacteriophage sp.]